ncbi:MAG: hypothetical protein HYV07_12160 [Deltaproteobacteria bacterium]|nr:hypothetical protein [Deltaproteobacteria bacterium]
MHDPSPLELVWRVLVLAGDLARGSSATGWSPKSQRFVIHAISDAMDVADRESLPHDSGSHGTGAGRRSLAELVIVMKFRALAALLNGTEDVQEAGARDREIVGPVTASVVRQNRPLPKGASNEALAELVERNTVGPDTWGGWVLRGRMIPDPRGVLGHVESAISDAKDLVPEHNRNDSPLSILYRAADSPKAESIAARIMSKMFGLGIGTTQDGGTGVSAELLREVKGLTDVQKERIPMIPLEADALFVAFLLEAFSAFQDETRARESRDFAALGELYKSWLSHPAADRGSFYASRLVSSPREPAAPEGATLPNGSE